MVVSLCKNVFSSLHEINKKLVYICNLLIGVDKLSESFDVYKIDNFY